MNSEQFIKLLKEETLNLQNLYSKGIIGETYIGSQIEELSCSDEIKTKVLEIVNEAVKENLYVLLSALEGSSSLAGVQQKYKIIDEHEKVISGELDSEYYMQVLENDQ
jgi:hypothetical protein